MSEAIICPACGARMRQGRTRCLRCRTPLPEVARPASNELSPGWVYAHWHVLAGGVGLLVVAVIALVMLRQPESTGPATTQAIAPRPQTTSVPGSNQPAAAATQLALADPDVIGRAAYRGGDYQAALERYRDAITRNPDDAESQSNCGQVLVRMGRTAEAVPYFERAVVLNGGRWAYHFNLAHARGLLGDWDRAIEEYQVAAGLFPDDHVTEYNLGMAFHKSGDEAAAVEHFKRAIDLAPTEADFELSLGISSERLGRTADATAAYRRYLELAPASPQAGQVRARVEMLASKTGAVPATPAPAAPPKTGGQ